MDTRALIMLMETDHTCQQINEQNLVNGWFEKKKNKALIYNLDLVTTYLCNNIAQ